MRYVPLICLFALAACDVSKPLPPSEVRAVVDACLEETQAPGTYSVFGGGTSSSPEGALPRASAVTHLGGTQAGADAVNTCIRRRVLG